MGNIDITYVDELIQTGQNIESKYPSEEKTFGWKTIPSMYLNFKTLLNDIIVDDYLTELQKSILQSLNNYFNLDLNVYSDDEISRLKEILVPCEYVNDIQWLFVLVDIRDMFYLKNYIEEQKTPNTLIRMFRDGSPIFESFMYQTFKKKLFLSLSEENTDAINSRKNIAERIEIWSKLHNVSEKKNNDVLQTNICQTDVKFLDETINITHINEKQSKKNSNKKNNEVRLDLSIDDVSNVLGFNISELKRESDILDVLHDSILEEKEEKKIIPKIAQKNRRVKKKLQYPSKELEIYNSHILRPRTINYHTIPRDGN